MTDHRRQGLLPLGLLVAGMVAACGVTEPSYYYTLPALDPIEAGAPPAASRALTVGIGPITLSDYLDRPQIVTRTSPNTVQLNEFDKWAESFDSLVPRTIAEDLTVLLQSDRVVLMPQPRSQRLDYQIEVDVIRFDALRGGNMELEALWRVYGRDGDRLIKDGRSRIALPVAADADFKSIVDVMGKGLEQLTHDLADTIKEDRKK
jgi:uncharacterized lipoprotein YmbA